MRSLQAFKTLIAPLCMAAALVLTPVAAFAQEIVTINIQSILRDSAAAKSAKTLIDNKRNQYQGELKTIEDKLRKEDKSLSEKRSILSPEALEQEKRKFAEQVTNAQKDVQDKRERLGEAYNEAVGEIQEAVMKIVGDMAKARGFKIVIPTNNLVYATPELDITQDVLSQLDKDLPRVDIKF
ncbi:MAG: OmpH family outer membrane protein [Alphaproteobacteria bacterium]|nr:OmpH family outer membrane protein [Alphaproteobacteria bacterium]